jgi:hypothetical protein
MAKIIDVARSDDPEYPWNVMLQIEGDNPLPIAGFATIDEATKHANELEPVVTRVLKALQPNIVTVAVEISRSLLSDTHV